MDLDHSLMTFVNVLGVVIFVLITAYHYMQAIHKNTQKS